MEEKVTNGLTEAVKSELLEVKEEASNHIDWKKPMMRAPTTKQQKEMTIKRAEEWEDMWKPIEGAPLTRQQLEKARCLQGLIRQSKPKIPKSGQHLLLFYQCHRTRRMLGQQGNPCAYRWRAERQNEASNSSDSWTVFEFGQHNHPVTESAQYVLKEAASVDNEKTAEKYRDYFKDQLGRLWNFVTEAKTEEEFQALKDKHGVYKDKRARYVLRCKATITKCKYKMHFVRMGDGFPVALYERGQHDHSQRYETKSKRRSKPVSNTGTSNEGPISYQMEPSTDQEVKLECNEEWEREYEEEDRWYEEGQHEAQPEQQQHQYYWYGEAPGALDEVNVLADDGTVKYGPLIYGVQPGYYNDVVGAEEVIGYDGYGGDQQNVVVVVTCSDTIPDGP